MVPPEEFIGCMFRRDLSKINLEIYQPHMIEKRLKDLTMT